MTRNIDAPGIQLNEIDRSQYNNTVDYSLPNSPNVLIAGFADNGPDYATKWINSKNTLIETYGYPTNEAEKYFYNACVDVVKTGGTCLASKLPYDNRSKDKYSYVQYKVNDNIQQLESPYQIANQDIQSAYLSCSLHTFLLLPNIDVESFTALLASNGPLAAELGEDTRTDLYTLFHLDGQSDTLISNILDLYDQSNITLTAITDLFNYMTSLCPINVNDAAAFKTFFYKDDVYCYNNACYRLEYLYSHTETEFIREYGYDDSLKLNAKNIREQLKNNPLFKDFSSILSNFGKSRSLTYYKTMYEKLKSTPMMPPLVNDFMSLIYNGFYKLEKLNDINTDIRKTDDTINKLKTIENLGRKFSGLIESTRLDEYRTSSLKPEVNKFMIVDKTRSKYRTFDLLSGESLIRDVDCMGIVPVITTAANAMLYQNIIEKTTETISQYSALSGLLNISSDLSINSELNIEEQNYEIPLFSTDKNSTTVSDTAASLFPLIEYDSPKYLNRKNIKKIGLVIFKMEKAPGSYDKISFTPVESFVGSFDRNSKDPITHSSQFIDNIVNESSLYVYFFSNVDEKDDFDIYTIRQQTATTLGFYKTDLVKDISLSGSITTSLNKVFDMCKDSNTVPIDIVIDAGVSNIAQFVKSVYWNNGYKGEYDLESDISYLFKIDSSESTAIWKQILDKYDIFCRNTRKDCMFIADGLRPLCLSGNNKLVENGSFGKTFDNTILPKLRYMNSLNSSYSAGYCNWYKMYDDYSGDAFWCPPSIKAASSCIYTDVYWHKWDAPAGMNRGKVSAVDIAFNPTNEEAGKIYNNAWNYAISYPISGIIIEGQKTFQRRQTAFDRINVRRLFLYLEKQVTRISKYFLYEGNTSFMRLKFVDTITPIFDDAVNGSGIEEYIIKCDDTNNTPQSIDRNELHCTIGVKPVKSIEYIVLNFICTNQSASVTEEVETII